MYQRSGLLICPVPPLTQEQESVLSHGPNFAVSPQKTLYGECITAIESACQCLDGNTAEELDAEVCRVLRHPHDLKSNLSGEKMKAIKQLNADKDQMVFTADKSMALVVMDRKEYIRKARDLLDDTNT